jgi:hypothetical protein
MTEPRSGEDALARMGRRVLDAEVSLANWRELCFQTARELESVRAAWATCKALKCCSVLVPPHDDAA